MTEGDGTDWNDTGRDRLEVELGATGWMGGNRVRNGVTRRRRGERSRNVR